MNIYGCLIDAGHPLFFDGNQEKGWAERTNIRKFSNL